jgi:hypothetical protein
MVQGTENSRFLLKALQTIGVRRKTCRKDLDCDASIEACVTSAIHFSHPARAQRRLDFVRTKFRA